MAMDIWMFVGKIEAFEEEGADRVLDRLQEVGIDSIVLGDLMFDRKPAYPATPELYDGCEKSPPGDAGGKRPPV